MVTHGLDATYKKGCRCQPCKTAQSIANCEKRMTLTGKPPTPGHGRRIIAETCRRCLALHTRDLGIATHVCPPRPLGVPKQERSMSDWRQPGVNKRGWRKVRASVLTRDNQLCRMRLTGCTTRATHVHHIFGRLTTGDDPRYLIAACPQCNIRTGNPGLLVELIHLRVHLTRLALDPAKPVEPGPAPAYGSPEALALVRGWVNEHGLAITGIEETPHPMTETPPPRSGKLAPPVTTHDPDQRPAIWVTTTTGRWPGREHARAHDGNAILAAWSENGIGMYQWVRATTTEARDV